MNDAKAGLTEKEDREGAAAAGPFAEEALSLTREFVHRFWNGGTEWCVDHLAENLLWIGAQDGQLIASRKAFRCQMESIMATRPRVVLMRERYAPIAVQDPICVVAGSYLGFSDPASDQLVAQEQRFTFVWRREGSGNPPKICHCHVSNPLPATAEGELQSVSVSRQTYLYIKAMLLQQRRQEAITVRDVQGVSRRISPDDIVCVEARKQRTVLHCSNGDVVVHGCMSNVLNDLDLDMVCVHRSFAVSARHVANLDKRNLTMDNGFAIEVPAKRLSHVRKELFG